LKGKSYLKCISHKCGKEYPISTIEFKCTCGNLLDVKYENTPSQDLKELFYQRRNPQKVYLMKVVYGDFVNY
tara:strand:- start:117 stop:332 length:216 start_codon:yes stop_codon:yes gene_type:complete